jgi:hypothetical protein
MEASEYLQQSMLLNACRGKVPTSTLAGEYKTANDEEFKLL